MDILFFFIVGILIGGIFKLNKFTKTNSYLQIVAIAVLIFSMGAMLGQREDLIGELKSLGISSVLFFIIPAVCSILLTYFVTRKWDKKGKAED